MTWSSSLRIRLSAWGNHSVSPRFGRERLVLLVGFALLAVLRLPRAWLQGRFFGEEGAIFFAYAWHRPWQDALFRSFGGYLNIVANASTLADARLVQAGMLSLRAAPYFTMTVALAVQLLPAILLLTSRAPWLVRQWTLIAALLSVVILPMTEEVFANVLHSQFHLALCAAIILADDVRRSRVGRVMNGALLFIAPLCGPGAIVLAPFVILRAVVDRDRDRAVQAGVIVLGAAVQLLLFFTPSPVRGQVLGPAVLGAIAFVRTVALPIGGLWLAKAIGTGVRHSYVDGGVGWWSATIGMLVYAGAFVAASLTRWRDSALWFVVPGLALAAVSFGGGMIASDPSEWFYVGALERYNYLPLVMMTLGLVALAARQQPRISQIAGWLVALTLAWGALAMPFPVPIVSNGPTWAEEVALWQRDHRHALQGWPSIWAADLSEPSRPCSPPGTANMPADEPSYCDGAWQRQINALAAESRAVARHERR